MATAALGAGAVLTANLADAAVRSRISASHDKAARAGISDAAYRKAWKRASAMVAKMTLAEKISQTGGRNPWGAIPAVKRLGIPAYRVYSGEALHGLVRSGPVTSFPLPLAMASSWNPSLALQVYTAVSDEARAYNKKYNIGLAYYSPQTLNLHRDPRWGRCEEAPGEDPCLAGMWAVNVVKGMQGDNSDYLKTTACAKHFMCNNTDDDRWGVSAAVSPRNFWEYYTRAYRSCVLNGDVFTVMSAYNAINGIPCSADRFLLTSLLRNRWDFRGYVTSDCDAIYNIFKPHHYVPTIHQAAALAIQAGCDFNCGPTLPNHLNTAVADELVSEADISRAVTRVLTVRVLFGEFDAPERVPYSTISFDVVDSQEHRALALEAARQAIVLLKNDNNFLPLQKSALKRVAVIGPMAGQCHLGGYSGSPFVRVSPYQGIAEALGSPGVFSQDHIWPQQLQAVSAGVLTQPSSEGGMNTGSIKAGSWLEYKPQKFVGQNHIAVRVSSPRDGVSIQVLIDSLDGPLIGTLAVPNTGGWQDWKTVSTPITSVAGNRKVFFKFVGRQSGPICNLEWFRLQAADAMLTPQPDAGLPAVIYKPGCSVQGPKDEKMFAEAVEAAKGADVVIMVCGVNQSVDTETRDRKNIELPGVQHELIQACFKANAKTVLVVSSNNTVAVNWEQENLPAIVSAIFAGQSQGAAIADVLFGDYNPGGKTCCTWYKSANQLPPFHNYDIIKGRTYMYFEGRPLYPFGYGLSYTTFHISDMHIDSTELSENKAVKISCMIANTGARAGAEVVQFYITAPKSPVERPIKELVGFQRVELKPGESRKVVFTLPYTAQALWYWHESQTKFVMQPGVLKLMIGNSSADKGLTAKVHLRACRNSRLGGPETLDTLAVPVMIS